MTPVTGSHATALAQLGHALSDGTRTRILLALREGPARPSDLAQQLDVSRQSMSNQLRCLRGCGLVEGSSEGRSTWYRLADQRIGSTLGDLLELVVTVDPNCCTPKGCTCR
ncbi:metalloregulator ArsR/SmtB family transcription factor [Citricoccus sp. I39-566]|uniref:ArsR/SmtB family transcription factor n=1 Tax=Citricoccus sp. I39-566 TaxID=3073268 RepID=UPI00286CC5D6|nr:metalloregulator ArsR/SmtB family transcription factor [Citricoccus sp. I39-566]WMY79741.1 metalloregulator ArsR/SmtB family transcription factor [Citricoccus sp. I39-566]